MSVRKLGTNVGIEIKKTLNLKSTLFFAMAASVATSANAFNFDIGPVEAQVDSNFSLGTSWRLQDPASGLISKANGGLKNSASYDDGNLNFDKGDQIATVLKGNHDLELKYNNFGAFFRGKYFYDQVVSDGNFSHRDLADSTVNRFGKGGKLLDAFVYGDFYIGDKPLSVRLGRQVISWGESLFIQGGINIINPFDVTAFRAPGAELKEGFVPTQKLYFNFGVTDNLSVEAYIDYDWKKTQIDACGTFWAPADFYGQGCDYVTATTGEHLLDNPGDMKDALLEYRLLSEVGSPDTLGALLSIVNTVTADNDLVEPGLGGLTYVDGASLERNKEAARLATNLRIVQRAPDVTPGSGDRQWGISARWFSPELNNTEFGLYYVRYHSKLPFLAPKAGDLSLGLANSISTVAGYINPNALLVDPDTGLGYSNQTVVIPASQAYRFIYPEDIDLYGFSFATSIETGFLQGLAIAGEWSYRPDMPVQQSLGVFLNRAVFTQKPGDVAGGVEHCPDEACMPFLDSRGQPSSVSEHQMHQIQVNFIYSWADVLGASQAILASEVGFIWLPDLEDFDGNPVYNPDGTLRFDTDQLGLDVSAQIDLFVTSKSYGIKNRAALIYNNVFAGVNLVPQVSFNYDIDGYAPGPGAAFIEGSSALGFSLTASYLNKYSASIGITKFYGTDTANEKIDSDYDGFVDTDSEQVINKIHDRDFASLSFQISL